MHKLLSILTLSIFEWICHISTYFYNIKFHSQGSAGLMGVNKVARENFSSSEQWLGQEAGAGGGGGERGREEDQILRMQKPLG